MTHQEKKHFNSTCSWIKQFRGNGAKTTSFQTIISTETSTPPRLNLRFHIQLTNMSSSSKQRNPFSEGISVNPSPKDRRPYLQTLQRRRRRMSGGCGRRDPSSHRRPWESPWGSARGGAARRPEWFGARPEIPWSPDSLVSGEWNKARQKWGSGKQVPGNGRPKM